MSRTRGRTVHGRWAVAGLVGLLALGWAATSTAQTQYNPYYGKNLVRYNNFDWHIYETDHFEIFYYPELEEHLGRVAGYAESAYAQISADLTHDLATLVPLMIFKTHSEFEQQNVIRGVVPLSLGLVGALSIVRFRTAVKEPEELAYLFLTIAIGLGLGAGQRLITILAFAVILAVLWVRALRRETEGNKNLFLTVTSKGDPSLSVDDVVELLRPHCAGLKLKRFDESDGTIDALFEVDFDDYKQLESATRVLREQNESVRVSFLESDPA